MQYKYINYYLKCCLYHYRTSAAAKAAEKAAEGTKGKSMGPFITSLPIIMEESVGLPMWARGNPCLWDRKNIHWRTPAKKRAVRDEKAAELNLKHPNLTPITGKF
jgi:hypothetical protein